MKRQLLSIVLVLMAPFGLAQGGLTVQAVSQPAAPQVDPPCARYTITDLGTLGGPIIQGPDYNMDYVI